MARTIAEKISKIETTHRLDLIAGAKLRIDLMVEELSRRPAPRPTEERTYFIERLTRAADEALTHAKALGL